MAPALWEPLAVDMVVEKPFKGTKSLKKACTLSPTEFSYDREELEMLPKLEAIPNQELERSYESNCWSGSELATGQYIYILNDDEVREIISALHSFKASGLAGSKVTRDTFQLPTLKAGLEAKALDLHCGKGIVSIRGLDIQRFTPEDNILIFLGISNYIADKIGIQDEEGHVLAHVRESKLCRAPQQERPFRDSNLALTFHTDGVTDILAMQVHSCASRGGNHVIASSHKIFQELASTRPDLVEVLMSPIWVTDSRAHYNDNRPRPILFVEDGRVIMNFVRYPLIGLPNTPRASHLPPVSALQIEALDAVEKIAHKHQLVLDMRPGDLVYINNLALVHSREAFEDDPSNARYLARLWLKNESLSWDIPPALAHGNDHIFYNEEMRAKWNIVPQPRLSFKPWERLDP